MSQVKKAKGEKTKIQQAIYKFRFSKEQQRDLKNAFDIFDKDGTGNFTFYRFTIGNIDIKDLKVILRALGFEPKEDEIKKLLSTINRSDEEDSKGFSANQIDFDEFLRIMSAKLAESEEIDQLKIGFFAFCDNTLQEQDKYITLESLKAVAKTLGEEVSDEELKEMMIEAKPGLKTQNTEYN